MTTLFSKGKEFLSRVSQFLFCTFLYLLNSFIFIISTNSFYLNKKSNPKSQSFWARPGYLETSLLRFPKPQKNTIMYFYCFHKCESTIVLEGKPIAKTYGFNLDWLGPNSYLFVIGEKKHLIFCLKTWTKIARLRPLQRYAITICSVFCFDVENGGERNSARQS